MNPISDTISASPRWITGPLTRLPALAVKQPWATSLTHFGKRIENRGWSGRYLAMQLGILARSGTNQFLIHASLGMTSDELQAWRDFVTDRGVAPSPEMMAASGGTTFRDLKRGGIVGVASFSRWVQQSDSPWWIGPGALELADVQPLDFYPCRGSQGFFFLPRVDDVATGSAG